MAIAGIAVSVLLFLWSGVCGLQRCKCWQRAAPAMVEGSGQMPLRQEQA